MKQQSDLNDELLIAFSDSARSLLHSRSLFMRMRQFRHQLPNFDRSMWQEIADAGWTSTLISEDLGGLSLGLEAACAIAQEIGRNPMPEPYLAGAVQASVLLNSLEASSLRDDLLRMIASGEKVIGVAWQTSLSATSQIDHDDLMIKQEGEHVTISGTRHWVYPAQADGWLLVCHQAKKIFWVPASREAISEETHFRVNGIATSTLRIDALKLSERDDLLAHGESVVDAFQRSVNAVRIAQASELVGISEKCFEMTLEYLKTRVQFDQPIGKNQALQHRMVDCRLYIDLAKASLRNYFSEVSSALEEDTERCAHVKARSLKTALHMVRESIQLHGAIGYTDEMDLGLYLKQVLHLSAWMGGIQDNLRQTSLNESEQKKQETPLLSDSEFASMAASDLNHLSEDQFRQLVRHFIQKNYPPELRHTAHRLRWHETKDWYLRLSQQGWIAPAWPKAFGGMGLNPDKLIAFIEEMEGYGVARLPDQGIINIGPVLIQYGSEEQKQYYLPKIISGEHVWCQGYSEPGAGSDLASLRTEAIDAGDEFVVTGQKIWTTLAQDATHIFLLVRTDKTVKKQAGISFLLVDMKSEGITVRPIENIANEHEFCEVFFDQVRVPKENLVGEMNQGWTIAKALLGFERLFVGSSSQARYALNQLRLIGQKFELFSDPSFCDQFLELQMDVKDLEALYSSYADIVRRGEALPPSVSLLKIWASETYSRIAMKAVQAAQETGADSQPILVNETSLVPVRRLYNSSITTIYGGTNEIQRNIVAKHVLGLPA